jgi:EAL domain-containing protein (putative c-di-GMP-specific phosphodiesterase class I)
MRLKADFIKIDGSIIKNILTDPNAQAVIKAIVFFAKECGIQTIAEFVETEEIYNAVCAYGIDYSQGYYFSKPAPIEETYA